MNTADLTFEQGVMAGAGAVAVFLFVLLVLKPWLRALFSGAPISIWYALGMRLRFSPVDLLLDAYLELAKSGFVAPLNHVECLYMKYKTKIQDSHDLAEIWLKMNMNQQEEPGQPGEGQPAPGSAPCATDDEVSS